MEKPKDPREFLANERTFLAWLRTGIAIMAFGFVVVKFSLFLRQISILSPQSQQILAEHHQSRGYSNWIGFFILLIGASVIPLAYLRFVQVNSRPLKSSFEFELKKI
jgi:putative membrane protein